MSALSKRQKAALCQAASAAYSRLSEAERAQITANYCAANQPSDDPLWMPSLSAVKTWWRRAQQRLACGEPSLTRCTQDDYLAILAHMQSVGVALESTPPRALLQTMAKQASEPRRVARWKLEQALAEHGLALGYAAAIARRQYRAPLEDLSERQLWQLVYTIRNRGNSKRRKTHGARPQHSRVS